MKIEIKCKDWGEWHFLESDSILKVGDLFQNNLEDDDEIAHREFDTIYQVTHVWFVPEGGKLEQHVVVKRTKLKVPM